MKPKNTRKEATDPLKDLLGYQLRRGSLVIMNDLHNRLESINMTPAMASVLMVIEANAGVKLIDIGYCLKIKRANMTPIISKLEERGLIEREIDGRSHALSLNTQGIDTTAQIRQLMHENEQSCFGHLDEPTQQVLRSALLSIRSELDINTTPHSTS